MTTTYPAVSLDEVGKALVRAHDAIDVGTDEELIENALVGLCGASYDVLLQWELAMNQLEEEPRPEPESWRTRLDELRVHAALAEMELRDHGGAPVVDLVSAVSGLVATARRDIGKALEGLRSELRKGTS